MEVFAITQYKDGIPLESIQQELVSNSGVVLVDYKMSSIHSSNSYLDIIQDYLEASFIAEELGKFSKSMTVKEISRYPYPPDCRYELVVKDYDLFSQRLRELSFVFSGEADEITLNKYLEEIEKYRDTLDDRVFLCPDLIDGYYVNLVEAAYLELKYELGKTYIKNEYKKYPERKFGFWKSAYSKTIGRTIYVSMNCWAIPSEVEIQKHLREYFGFSELEVHDDAVQFNLDGVNFVISKYAVDYFPIDSVLRMERFVKYFLSKQDSYISNLHKLYPKQKYLLSRTGYSMMIQDGLFSYLFFPEPVKESKILDLYSEMSSLFGAIAEFSGINKDIRLPWNEFDDEKFENLCYDIIYHLPQFDNKTIRKMGKSRSRDGGRDITIYTNERPGSPKKLYIFQCKFTKVGTSLTTQKVENISDTVVQYGGQGYGVMTPVVIDSALYDRIDAICEKFKIESHNWSILEIERYIARHPKLRERHFGS